MDTIARSVSHPYYLRSLHIPETIAGIRGPKATLELPQQSAEGVPPAVVGVARTYAPLPRPDLPPPPMPQGQSSADLYQSLFTRDEQIRKNLVRQTSLTRAAVVVGACPDMCPEKERYMREDRRRLSWFELDHHISQPGAPKVDHQRAVKEYNRSAADKAEDLPHELRPEPVLLMTMDYLVTCVMDEREGRTEMWYDFVWNRTRAIRKDITLQHLCSKGCVELTEKCARFHILCAYLLCEEEINVFDQKMNHENLTKCLITLTHFYRDLRIEQAVYCGNEAEFCCYDILLHLRDGNVLNLVEQYSPAIRQSNFIRFAVDIALAFSSNNYAKFFKLVRSPICSYLCACILHRYFSEIRTTALHVMTKAYTLSKPTSFPLTKFTEILRFENEVLATDFCVHFDLSLTKKMVKLAREFAHHPPSSLPALLAPSLVGAKRVNRRLGEIVNGGPLPLPPNLPRPYDSFAPGTPLAPPTPTRPTPPVYSDKDLTVAIDLILEEITRKELFSVAMEMLQNERDKSVKQATVSAFCESLTSECVGEECTSVAMATLENAQREWQVRENAQLLDEVAKVISMEIEFGIIIEQVSQVIIEGYEELVTMATSVCDDITWECVRSVTGDVCVEVVREAELVRQEKLEQLEKLVLAKRRKRYWEKWCCLFKARCHARECVSAIPSLPPLLPLSAQPVARRQLPGETLISGGSLEIGEGRVADFLEAERCGLEERRKKISSPLDLPYLLSHSLLVTRPPSLPPLPPSHHTSPHIYWSLALLHSVHPDLPHSQPGDLALLGYLEQKLTFRPPGAKPSGDKQNLLIQGFVKFQFLRPLLQK
ncbi:Germinal-center associated nuclear protein [Geodia barretti]|uniref:Germinal-center associated nuclear protein n=1 Tax=Geodia barretti TaxID=519541 RepID=A0AA35VV67_GEOBA|nr:Germinal-center associated nuclear protein [Geodia barretti]